MGILSLGGSASASNTLSNIINFNPNMQFGSAGASNDLTSSLDQRASSEALVKDEAKMSASAGVALGPNSSAMGGTASLADSSGAGAGMSSNKAGVFDSKALEDLANNTPLLIGAGVVVLAGAGLYILKKKRK